MIKIAITPVHGVTQEEFDTAMEQYSEALQAIAQLQTARQEELDRTEQKYAPALAILQHRKDTAFAVAETYCSEQKAKLFAHRRSLGTPYGIAGYRLGTPRLRIRKGYTRNMVQELLAAQLPGYVRTTVEPAKALLLAHRHTEQVASKLHSTGLEVVQDDVFYIRNPVPQALQKCA